MAIIGQFQDLIATSQIFTGAGIKDGITKFDITDRNHQIEVLFDGPLPDLFREGQGIVVEGMFRNNKLIASEVLAKHDENYMPPEVADALIKNGVWQGEKKRPKLSHLSIECTTNSFKTSY